jgi:hypothetical protein
MGYRGPTVFGENTSGLYKDPFGVNVRSAFGNYAEKVRDEYGSLGESLGGRLSDKYGATFNPETGMFESEDEEAAKKANKMTNLMRKKYTFRRQQIKQQEFDKKIAEQKAAEAAAKAEAERAAQYGKTNYGEGAGGQSYSGESIGAGNLGFGVAAGGMGGPVSNRTGRGRTDYMDGGLADLVDIYD